MKITTMLLCLVRSGCPPATAVLQFGQFQLTAPPAQGISQQGTFTISKTMGLTANGYRNPLNPELDYREPFSSIGREFSANNSFELPIGLSKRDWVIEPTKQVQRTSASGH